MCNNCGEQVAKCDSVIPNKMSASRLHVAGELATCSAAGESNVAKMFHHVSLSTSPPEAAESLRSQEDTG